VRKLGAVGEHRGAHYRVCGQPQRSSRLFAPLYSDTAIYGMTFGGVPLGAVGDPEAALLIDVIAQDGAGGGVRNDLLSERPLVPQLLDKSTCTSHRSPMMRPMTHATAGNQ
jgi:hypothetical protein